MCIAFDPALSPIGYFLVGFATGFIVALLFQTKKVENVRLKLALLITAIWAITVLVGTFDPDHSPGIFVHAIMGAVAGYLFGGENPIISLGGNK